MYELEQINPKVIKKYYETIAKITSTKHHYIILQSIMKDTFYHLIPTQNNYFVKDYISKLLEPLRQQIEAKYKVRKFNSEDEANQIFKEIESRMDFKAFDTLDEKKDYEDIIDFFYDFLDYDLCATVNSESFLYSYLHIVKSGMQHEEVYEKWKKQDTNKPSESNYDISRNTNDTKAKMVAFKLNYLKNELANPSLNENLALEYEYQKDTLLDFTTHSHITAKAISEFKRIKDDYPNDTFIKAKTNLAHTINANAPIEKIDIFRSFFASVIGVYTFTSKINAKKLPYRKLYEFATKLSELIFPELQSWKEPLYVEDRIKKPIVETKIFNGYPLVSFADGRKKIKKEQKEIIFTEKYLTTFIDFSQRYLHLSKS